MKITVAGIGYVGLSNAVLLAQKHDVTIVDIDDNRVNLVNQKKSPIKDKEIEEYLATKKLNLSAVVSEDCAFTSAEMVIIATPTNYDPEKNFFDTKSVESVIQQVQRVNSDAVIIIKSTIPVGYTKSMQEKYPTEKIIFSPEFLREGHALYDNLYPSRIVVGDKSETGIAFAQTMKEVALKEDIKIILTDSTSAEAIKLFSNTYLALRIAYFNELDTYAEVKDLNTLDIIQGVCSDPRIGDWYNNPSFGYGGYCLPKDTKQLRANFDNVPSNLIGAIVDSNDTRKKHIAQEVLQRKPKKVGIYRLVMKEGSDNFRSSSIQDIMQQILQAKVSVVIYEPTIHSDTFQGTPVEHDLNQFKKECDVILCNRMNSELKDICEKVYTRDLFQKD